MGYQNEYKPTISAGEAASYEPNSSRISNLISRNKHNKNAVNGKKNLRTLASNDSLSASQIYQDLDEDSDIFDNTAITKSNNN